MSEKHSVDRRDFLKTAAVTGAAALSAGSAAAAAEAPQGTSPTQASAPVAPREVDPGGNVEVLTTDRPGGDFMVDVIKTLDFEFIASNPGSSFRGIHESIINYGNNTKPEFITCCHEESAVAMAHGYFKAEGRPMAVLCHGTVGMQHAAMAIYNAYCDRVPVYVLAGNSLDATLRRPGVEWAHSVQDAAAMVRDFIKWDDQPISLPHFAESAMRAYKIAMTPPMMPVLLVIDGGLQEDPISHEVSSRLRIPRLTVATPPQGDSGAVAEAARLLVSAQNPVIVADRAARTPAGITHLIALAEALQAPVVSQGGRMNFPSRHPLNQTSNSRQLIADADVILGLELTDFWGTVSTGTRRTGADVAVAGQAGNEAHQHHRTRSRHQGQLSGFPALSRGGRGDGRRRRSHASGARRGLQTRDVTRSPKRLRGSRKAAGDGACVRARTGARRSRLRLGRIADQHRAHDDGTVGPD